MRWTSIVAIYSLFWVLSAFLVMPFHVRTHEELGERAALGHAESAPARFRPGVILLRTTLLALALFGLFYANYTQGWIGVQTLNVFGDGPVGYRDPNYVRSN